MLTGIDAIDEIGGIPERSNVLLIGPPGTEKVLLSIKTLDGALRGGGKGIYVTTDLLPTEIEERAKKVGVDLDKYTNKSLWFVDCYSWTLGEKQKKSERKDIIVPGPSALNDLSIGIAQSVRNAADGPKIVFQSLSTLLMYNNPEIVFRFLQITGARLKLANATTIFHCEADMHDERTLTTLKHLVDEIIEIKIEAERNLILSHTLGLKEWKEFKL